MRRLSGAVVALIVISSTFGWSGGQMSRSLEAITPATPSGNRVIDTDNVESLTKVFQLDPGNTSSFVWSPHAQRFAIVVPDGIKIYDTNRLNEPPVVLHVPRFPLMFSPDWKFLAAAGPEKTIELWDLQRGMQTATLRGHSGLVSSLAFSPDGTLLASASGEVEDRGIRLWDIAHASQVALLEGHTSDVTQLAFSPNGELLASASNDNTVRLWRVADSTQVAVLRQHENTVIGVTFSPDSSMLASMSVDRSVVLWSTTTYRSLYTYPGISNHIGAVFSPDGSMLAIEDVDEFDVGVVHLWSTRSGQDIAELKGHHGEYVGAVFNPSGTLIATFGQDDNLRLWNARTAQLLRTIVLPGESSSFTAFSPDGTWLAWGGRDGAVELWGIKT